MKPRAFSLLEVVLAIGLIALLAGSVVGFVFQLADRRAVLLAHSRRLIAADAMMEAIEADVFTCLAGDARRGAGVQGDAASLRVLSRAVQLGMQRSRERIQMDDLRSTEYRFDEGRAAVTVARASVLFTDAGAGGEREVLLDGVERVRFRYYDRGDWLTTFDSGAVGRLPQAIEIAVWFTSPGGTSAPAPARAAPDTPLDQIDYLDELGDEEAAPPELDSAAPDEDLPPPDRLRIIVVPDAGGDGPDSAVGGPS